MHNPLSMEFYYGILFQKRAIPHIIYLFLWINSLSLRRFSPICSHSQIARCAAVRCVNMQWRYITITSSLLRRVANTVRMVNFSLLTSINLALVTDFSGILNWREEPQPMCDRKLIHWKLNLTPKSYWCWWVGVQLKCRKFPASTKSGFGVKCVELKKAR